MYKNEHKKRPTDFQFESIGYVIYSILHFSRYSISRKSFSSRKRSGIFPNIFL
nr:MAG TPA: hypothetical protein [Caudoviricetes sp.]